MIISNIIVVFICVVLIIFSTIITIDTFENKPHVTSSDELLEIAKKSNVPAETTPEKIDGNSYTKPCEMPTDSDETTSDLQKEMYCKNIKASENALNSQKYMEESSKVTTAVAKNIASSNAMTPSMGSSKDPEIVEALRKKVKHLQRKVDKLEKKCNQ